MIKFETNTELNNAFEQLILSMVEVDKYLGEILNYVGSFLTPRKEKELIAIFKKYQIPHNNLQRDPAVLMTNPYYQDIKLNNASSPTAKYEENIIKKRTLMPMGFHKPIGKYLFHYHPIGYYETDIRLPTLIEGDAVWMSPVISEIDSMSDGISKGRGKCLTMGLGIGVLLYLWLLKDDVESVTVVELNQDIIKLFETYIKPQFKTDKRLEIIHGNAFDYYNEEFLHQFDYVYVDFWESTEDGLDHYTRLMEKDLTLENIDYWVEDSMLCDLKYIVALYLNAVYQGKSITSFIAALDQDAMKYAKKTNRYFKENTDIITTEAELLALIHNKKVLRKILAQ